MLPLHIAVQKGTSVELLALLASHDMPVSRPNGEPVFGHSHSWSFLVAQDSNKCFNAVALLLDAPAPDNPAGYDYGKHVEALAEVLDQGGRKALEIAKSGPRQSMHKHLLSGYKVMTIM